MRARKVSNSKSHFKSLRILCSTLRRGTLSAAGRLPKGSEPQALYGTSNGLIKRTCVPNTTFDDGAGKRLGTDADDSGKRCNPAHRVRGQPRTDKVIRRRRIPSKRAATPASGTPSQAPRLNQLSRLRSDDPIVPTAPHGQAGQSTYAARARPDMTCTTGTALTRQAISGLKEAFIGPGTAKPERVQPGRATRRGASCLGFTCEPTHDLLVPLQLRDSAFSATDQPERGSFSKLNHASGHPQNCAVGRGIQQFIDRRVQRLA